MRGRFIWRAKFQNQFSNSDVALVLFRIIGQKLQLPQKSHTGLNSLPVSNFMEFGDFVAAPPADVELDRKLYTMLEIEQRRYEGFFTALDESHAGTLPRATVLAFYAKSALSDPVRVCMY